MSQPPTGAFGPPSGPGQYPSGQYGRPREAGFFASLFDLTFSKFATPIVLGVLYGLLIFVIALAYVIATVAAFAQDQTAIGVAILILGPIVGFIVVIFVRIRLEFVAAAIRTAQNTSIMIGRE